MVGQGFFFLSLFRQDSQYQAPLPILQWGNTFTEHFSPADLEKNAFLEGMLSQEKEVGQDGLDDEDGGDAKHPAHVAVANTKVRPYTVQRACLDFEI